MTKAAGASLLLLASLMASGAYAQTSKTLAEPPVAYIVRPGDTLIGLGRAYLNRPGDYRAVQKTNRVQQPKHLRPGSQLNIDPNLLKSTPIAATLSAFSGPVQVESGGQRIPARVGMPLAEGQVVITGPGAFATFELEDASRVTLPSNTRVRITKLRQTILNNAPQRVFQLDQGRGTISATPTQNPAARFEVRTPVSVSAVRGTEFRVGADGDKAQTEVLKGAVGVDPGAVATTAPPVPAGFGVSASAGGGVGAPVKLLPAPKLGAGGQTQGDTIVRFTLEPVTGAAAYRLQLAHDAGFVDIFAETKTQTTSQARATADFGQVANGTYFVRLTAIDPGGLEGFPADYSFDRDLDTLDAAAPGDSREGKHRKFLFRWSSAGDGVRNYRFQMFKGEDTQTPVVDQPGLTEPQVTLTDLPPGAYNWRVVVTRFKNGVVTEKLGNMAPLQIGK